MVNINEFKGVKTLALADVTIYQAKSAGQRSISTTVMRQDHEARPHRRFYLVQTRSTSQDKENR